MSYFSPRASRSQQLKDQLIGNSVSEISTPSLVLDLDALDHNLDTMRNYVESVNKNRPAGSPQVVLRPHAKLHKCAALAKKQLTRGGAVGMCVQKISEAEALFNDGVRDLFVSNELVDEKKIGRLIQLHRQTSVGSGKITLCVDSIYGLDLLFKCLEKANSSEEGGGGGGEFHAPLGVFIEVECGQKRCGVAPASEAALNPETPVESVPLLKLAQRLQECITSNPKVIQFAGIHAYHGFAQHIRSYADRQSVIQGTINQAKRSKDAIESRIPGMKVPLVTGAGTGTFSIEATSGLYGEIQPGSYMVMDKDYGDNFTDQPNDSVHPGFKHALFIKAQVVSWHKLESEICPQTGKETPLPNGGIYRIILDAGHKTGAIDSGLPGLWNPKLGRCFTPEEIKVGNGGDDHTLLEFPISSGGEEGNNNKHLAEEVLSLGKIAWLVPNHCDPTFNLHDFGVGVRGGLFEERDGKIEEIFEIDARGCQW